MKRVDKGTIKWINVLDTVLVGKTLGKETGRTKIAAFDLDGTLITTKSGRTFPKDEHDWRWWCQTVPKRIEELYKEGYEIVVFSNQNGLNSDKKIKSFKIKIENILNQLSPPVFFMAALAKDKYRKPMTGMWHWFVQQHDQEIDKDACFYVGDAAGRDRKPKKDHSCVDRKFADNLQVAFHTPEEFFLNEPKADFEWLGFNAKEHPRDLPLLSPPLPSFPATEKNEVVICVGYPASGKSSFVKKHLVPKGYVYVNQDELKTRDKCIKACQEALSNEKSVVIDNTNPEKSTRQLYIQLAQKAGVPVRCLYFGQDENLAQHNNHYRAIHESSRDLISKIVFRTFKSKFQEPTMEEGFAEIQRVNFVFDGSDKDYEEWKKWWI
ncbi:PNK3P-domain-containing protein [Rhizopus microsporus]|nr:PNK3P-domain-containing protein [Rhizopus microsporus]